MSRGSEKGPVCHRAKEQTVSAGGDLLSATARPRRSTRAAGSNVAPVLPLGGAVAPAAPTCTNAGQSWRVNRQLSGFGLLGEPAGAPRVTCCHSAAVSLGKHGWR